MRILHYSLGFPPYRTGGMTKFCIDLAKQQIKEGHEVALLWPGEIKTGKKTKILDGGFVDGIKSWEVINPTPVSYDEGIKEFDPFMAEGDFSCYEKFLELCKPEVIHIHTFMGLHKNLLVAAHNKKIRIVFTSHDFFPICPKVTLFRNGGVCNSAENCEFCDKCNETALPLWKIKILQTKMYRTVKDNLFIKKLRKNHRDAYLGESQNCNLDTVQQGNAYQYKRLREFYASFFKYVDVIHYNSNLTKTIFEQYIADNNAVVIPISHSDIRDCRKNREYTPKELKITYLGPYSGAKGFFVLNEALRQLWDEGKRFSLNIFFRTDKELPYAIEHDRYDYGDLERIFDDTDVLVVPSIWYETFGYTVLEALSFAVPVIVSSHVGAREIIPAGAGLVVEAGNINDLKKAIQTLTVSKLATMHESIKQNAHIYTIQNMSQQIFSQCYLGEQR